MRYVVRLIKEHIVSLKPLVMEIPGVIFSGFLQLER